MSQVNIGSATKNGKSEMSKIMWDGLKWNTGYNME